MLTNSDINNYIKIKLLIYSHPHPYDQLRECEQFILKYEEGLVSYKTASVVDRETLKLNKLKLQQLADKTILESDIIKKQELECEKAKLQHEIAILEYNMNKLISLVRDAEFHLQLVVQEKEAILQKYPEMLELDYEEMQKTLAVDSYYEEMKQTIACKYISSVTNYSEDVLRYLMRLDPLSFNNIVSGAVDCMKEMGFVPDSNLLGGEK